MKLLPTFSNNCDGTSKTRYLNVALTAKCPNNCIYCAAKQLRKEKENIIDVEKIADNIISLSPKYQQVVINGGEPLLFPEKVKMLIDFIRPYVKNIYMFTALPQYDDVGKPTTLETVTDIIKRLDGTNISVGAYEPNDVAAIMGRDAGLATKWRNDIIRQLSWNYNDKFRLSILLCKDHMDTEWKVKRNIEFFYQNGARNFKVGELSHCPELFVPISKVMPGLNLGDPCWDGCSHNMKLSDYWYWQMSFNDDSSLLIKRACWMVEPSLKPTNKEYIKLTLRNLKDRIIPRTNYKVVYSDGSVANSWPANEEL